MILTVLYPSKPGARFDYEYYVETHTALVREAWSPEDMQVVRGVAAPDGGEAPFRLIAHIGFASRQALDAALGGAMTPAVFADVGNFTDIAPVAVVTDTLT